MPVDRDGRIRLVRRQQQVRGFARRLQFRIANVAFLEHGGIAGGHQQQVPLAQRNVEPLRQMQHHIPARQRPAGLKETQMAGRYIGFDRKVELAEPAALSPFAQQ